MDMGLPALLGQWPPARARLKVCLSCGHRFASESWACPVCSWEPEGGSELEFAPELASGDAAFVEDAFEPLAAIEESSFWFRSRNELIAWAVAKYFPRAENLLEVGCGTGFVLAGLRSRFPKLELVGAELFASGLAEARTRLPRTTLYQMDARRIPFEQEFDLVCAFDVLEHVHEDEQVIEQLHQATKPGGGVLITVPQHPRLWSAVDDFSRHQRRYTRLELIQKLQDGGLALTRTTSFVTLLLPPLVLSRAAHRRDQEFDPATEYQMPRLADRTFERVMQLERWWIERGVSFRIGGSLLAVARRPG
jgi:SAM-dependent methyltransferase